MEQKPQKRKVVKMDINTWIKEVKEGEAELTSVTDKQVRIIMHHLFTKLNNNMHATTENASFRMAGLGRFRISFKNRKEGAEPVKQIIYTPENQVGRWAKGKDEKK